MNVTKYLVITQGDKSWKSSVKLLNKLGTAKIAANAVVLKLNLDLPDALFKKPQLEATLKVDADQVSAPVIQPEILQNIQQVMSQQFGVDMNIQIVHNKTKK